MGQKNIIELNGKKYDALTGAFLGESRVKATKASRASLQRHGRVVDGFVRAKPAAGSTAAPTVIKPQPLQKASQPKHITQPAKKTAVRNIDVHRVSPKAAIQPHQPERPKTLMRHVVKKPDVSMKPSMKTAVPAEIMAAPKSTIAKPLEKKLSASNINPFRLARSRHVAKSHHIHRFERPRPQQAQHTAVQAQRPAQYAVAPVRANLHAAGRTPQVIVSNGQAVQKPGVSASAAAPREHIDVFEAALAHATSHEQQAPAHIRRRNTQKRRLVNAMAGVGAFLLLAGFVGYMNMTNIELRVASMRAGFHAQMPQYKPSGYALEGGIQSIDGKVAMNFRSGNSTYTITQEASDWNSVTLLDQTAAERGEPSQTIQSKGRTIYIYDDSNATWVNGGVRYQVNGNAPLNADELVSLATSM